jgi:hypothetical protein
MRDRFPWMLALSPAAKTRASGTYSFAQPPQPSVISLWPLTNFTTGNPLVTAPSELSLPLPGRVICQ